MEIKIIVAAVVRRFEISVDKGQQSDEDMEIRSHFAAYPKGKKCDLVFRVRHEGTREEHRRQLSCD